jgi:hypothetical protein
LLPLGLRGLSVGRLGRRDDKMSDETRLRTALETIKAKIIARELTGHVGSPGALLYIDKTANRFH